MRSEIINSIQEPLCRTNFSQYCISHRGHYLWNKIVISKNLTFSDSDSLRAFRCEFKRFLLSIELNDLEILKQLLSPSKNNSHKKLFLFIRQITHFETWNLKHFMKLVGLIRTNHAQVLVIRSLRSSSSFLSLQFNLTLYNVFNFCKFQISCKIYRYLQCN